MTDRPRGSGGPEKGTPEYEWLYGGAGPQDPDVTQPMPGAGSNPDATRVLPTMPRPGRSGGTPPPSRPPAPPPTPPVAPRKPRPEPPPSAPRRRRRWLRWVAIALCAWLVYLLVVPFWAWTKVSTVDAFPNGDRPAEQPGTTYLLVGSDSREGLSRADRRRLGTGGAAGQRTDTIMLLHVGSGPNLLMSIPRDSLVDIPDYGRTKINAAFAYGGPKLLVRTVEQNTGIRIDHYVEIGFGGFVGVVDAVGGIEICPTFDMVDPQANLDIEKGCQHADGVTALGFARSRKTDPQYGDITRAQHQREVVAAVGDKAISPWTFINPARYWRLNMAAAESLRVSEGTGPIDMARFALGMTRTTGDDGLTCTVPIVNLSVEWDPERSERMFGHIIADETDKIGRELCTPKGLPR